MARNIDLGSKDNLFENAVANIKEVLNLYQREELGIRFSRIYEEDIQIPINKSVSIDIGGHSAKLRSWISRQKRNFAVAIDVDIWYYHEQLNDNTRSRDVKTIISRMVQMFMKHHTINGFCEPLGCTILGSHYTPRVRGNRIMASGLVRLRLNRLHTVENLD